MNNHIAIIIPVFNAPDYVKKCIDSIKITSNINYTIVIVDNNSDSLTKNILHEYVIKKQISILCSLESNRLFAKANNIGVKILPEYCNKILLLNSDVEIKNPLWLDKMLQIHETGATSIGVVNSSDQFPDIPSRCDGYCFLIDRHLYEKYWLDENYPWWWSITKIQGQLLNDNFTIKAVVDRNNIIKHYKHQSKNFDTIDHFKKIQPDNNWFITNNKIKIIDNL